MFFDYLIESIGTKLGGRTIAVVPGSFKPPHRGHLEMVKKYAKMADEVIVLIGAPTEKSQRLTVHGNAITPEQAKQIFDIYIQDEGLHNVHTLISTHPSPIKAAYEFIEFKLKDVNVILGASRKDGDYKRWERAPAYFAVKNPSVKIIDPKRTAVNAITAREGDHLSASEFRASLDNPNAIDRFLPPSVIEKGDKAKILLILTSK
jgi:cytidyltransferase-like protein